MPATIASLISFNFETEVSKNSFSDDFSLPKNHIDE
jgi:hypothetical protein